MKKNMVLLFIFFILLSCDYGLDSGSDLIGSWELEYDTYISSELKFNDDNTGYKYYYDSKRSGSGMRQHFNLPEHYYIKYKVCITDDNKYNYVKLLKYEIEDESEIDEIEDEILKYDYYPDDEQFVYYFSSDKNYLYIKYSDDTYFSTYKRQ